MCTGGGGFISILKVPLWKSKLKSRTPALKKGKGGGETDNLNRKGLCVPWRVLDGAGTSQVPLPGLLGGLPEVRLAGEGWEVFASAYGGRL